jgi:hypothetical protein
VVGEAHTQYYKEEPKLFRNRNVARRKLCAMYINLNKNLPHTLSHSWFSGKISASHGMCAGP